MRKIFLCILAVVAIIGYGIWINQGISEASNQVEERWMEVEVVYTERLDLITDFLISVEEKVTEETSFVKIVNEAIKTYITATTTDTKALFVGEIEAAYAQFLLVLGNYPDIGNISYVKALREALEVTEGAVTDARIGYNEAVRGYNGKITGFPASIVARLFGHTTKTYFQSVDGI